MRVGGTRMFCVVFVAGIYGREGRGSLAGSNDFFCFVSPAIRNSGNWSDLFLVETNERLLTSPRNCSWRFLIS